MATRGTVLSLSAEKVLCFRNHVFYFSSFSESQQQVKTTCLWCRTDPVCLSNFLVFVTVDPGRVPSLASERETATQLPRAPGARARHRLQGVVPAAGQVGRAPVYSHSTLLREFRDRERVEL